MFIIKAYYGVPSALQISNTMEKKIKIATNKYLKSIEHTRGEL